MKSNQKSSQPGCFLAAHGLPCKADKTTGCIILLQVAQAIAVAKRRYALSAALPNLFYRLSPEAARLTVSVLTNNLVPMHNQKKKRWPVSARGRVSGPREVAAIAMT